MSNLIVNAMLGAALVLSASHASAGGWEVWTEKSSADRLVVVASFTGEGSIDEAQLDLEVNSGFEVIEARALGKGTICFGNPEVNILRSVPPSGAGKALKSSAVDACMFTLRVSAPKGWAPAEMVSTKFVECASSSEGGVVPCQAKFSVVQ